MFQGLKRKSKQWKSTGLKVKGIFFYALSLILILFGDRFALANDDFDLDAIEREMSRRGEEQAESSQPSAQDRSLREDAKQLTFQDLPKLSAFSDVTVIQKRFMPKTNRFQIYGGVDFLTNNPFFDSYGFNGRFSFFFTESLGVEIGMWSHSVSPRTITADLQSKYRITTKTMLSSLSYLGASLIYIPFYGKMTFLDKVIIPYDFYFSIGGGTTETSYLDKTAPSIHLGTGEIFSITKSFAWRWDLSYVSYTARIPDVKDDGSLVDSGKKQSLGDLYLGIGLTLLFPGASYR